MHAYRACVERRGTARMCNARRRVAPEPALKSAAACVCLILVASGLLSADPLEVKTGTDKYHIAIGDTVSLNIDLEWESGVELKPVAARERLGNFIVRDIREGMMRPAGDGFSRRVSLLLTVFETGEQTIPSIPILFTDADGMVGRRETEPVEIVVESVLAEDSTEIRDIKPPLTVRKRWREIILSYVLLIGLAGAAATSVLVSVRKKSEIETLARRAWERITRPVLALVAWLLMLLRRRREPAAAAYDIEVTGPEIPPEQAAFEELARIEALSLIEQGLIKELYTLVSEVLRRYIERKYDVLAMELPTSYIMEAIAGRRVMSACYGEVREALEECDLVKFAKHVPPDEAVLTIIPRARGIVRVTSEPRPAGGGGSGARTPDGDGGRSAVPGGGGAETSARNGVGGEMQPHGGDDGEAQPHSGDEGEAQNHNGDGGSRRQGLDLEA